MRIINSALVVALFATALHAAFAGAGDLAPIPPLRARVTDVTRTLSAGERNALEEKLAAFEQRKGAQIAILMVPTTQPEAIEQYSIRVAEAWKIGRARVDDGLIVVVAKNDHRLRIEVGYGLEGAIPDVVAKRVIREIIAPHFLAGEFYAGLDSGATALMGLVEGEALPPPPQSRGTGQETDLGTLPVVFGIVMFVAFVIGRILTAVLGRFVGSLATGGIAAVAAWAVLGIMIASVGAGLVGFVLALVISGTRGGWIQGVQRGTSGWGGSSWGGGSWGGGGSRGGGGGVFGGGGASGNW